MLFCFLGLVLCADRTALATPIDLTIQIVWGDGDKRQWRGRVSIDQGGFSDLRLLGMTDDAPGSILTPSHISGRQILIQSPSRRTYDGLQLVVRGEPKSELRVELLSENEIKSKSVVVQLEKLIDGYESLRLDETGNRLVIKRIPSDRLRVQFNPRPLVFSPGEKWAIAISPNQLLVPEKKQAECRLSLIDAMSGESTWSNTLAIETGVDGSALPLVDVEIPIPNREGVYNLQTTLIASGRRFTFRKEDEIAQRIVQFVVVGNDRPTIDTPGSRYEVIEFDPSQQHWWERLTRRPQLSLVPGFRQDGPLGNHKPTRRNHQDRDWTQLQPRGWQAYPIPIKDVGAPHEIEIEYPSDIAQTTTFSVIEPNRAGKVLPIGLDSGIHISEEEAIGLSAGRPDVNRHRLVFWPRTKSPLLLVNNRRDDAESLIGSIRVIRQADVRPSLSGNHLNRKVFANLERPLFPENFSAAEALDERSGRSLDDWSTFYAGAVRLIEHLREHGYDGLAVACFSEGSTLYPSDLLQPTPKHDRGVYFADGRDPVRKDILEMLFRLCDREGITFLPALDFSTPLPALERQLRHRSRSIGIRLVDSKGQTWAEANNDRGGASRYNPLDPRVQSAMQAVIREILKRYGHHRSFGGIQLIVSPASYTHLPGLQWGMDASTLARFKANTNAPLADLTNDLPQARNEIMSPRIRDAWISWRCKQLAEFYERVQDDIAGPAPDKKLFVTMTNLIDAPGMQRVFQPNLLGTENSHQAMRNLGIDTGLFKSQANTVLVRPRQIDTRDELDQIGPSIEMNLSRELDAQFTSDSAAGEFSHVAQRVRLSEFDEVSPFGRGNTVTLLVAHVSPADAANRRRFVHSLASRDVHTLFEGGWMLPLGQEASLDPFLQVFRQLPAVAFDTFKKENNEISPLVIRTATHRGSSFMYVVNDSPWHVGAEVTTNATMTTVVSSLDQRDVGPLQRHGDSAVLPLELKPYDLMAITFDTPNVKPLDAIVTLPPEVEPALTDRITSIKSRARFLRNPPELELVTNPSFESNDNDSIPGWFVESLDVVESRASVVSEGFESQMALQLTNKHQSLIVRSDAFTLPESRQLSASIHLRSKSTIPPRIKLSIESEEREYELWRPILNETSGQAITREWQEFVFPLKKLPKTIGAQANLRIDLIGHGIVLIDQVKLYDSMLLRQAEHGALGERIALLDFALRSQAFGECLRGLEGYWPRYLMENVPEAPAPVEVQTRTNSTKPAVRTSQWDRFRRMMPKLPTR